jgi:hypothetical protein
VLQIVVTVKGVMVRNCVVSGCHSKHASDVRLFSIPLSYDNRNPDDFNILSERRLLWLSRLHIHEGDLKKKSFVCHKHFVSDNYYL